jgi:UDP-GlcNAc3NAcA epimerase
MLMKVLTIVGARPQFVKAAVVSRAFATRPSVVEVLVHTGQHFDHNMSDLFFEELGMRAPDHHLGVGGGSHAENTGRAMESIEKVLVKESPDYVLVYGDTDSTLAGALAAAKLCIPLAHVEAGLRSFNQRMPEEINRVLTDHISSVLFTPTRAAVVNLEREGIVGDKVRLVGDVMYDAVKIYTAVAERRSDIMRRLGLEKREYVLATLHRKENTDDPLRLSSILGALATNDGPVVLPIHPRTKKRVAEFGLRVGPNVMIIDPLGYLDMMLLTRNARLVATDSGGLQKEAFFHGVPCITLREETEWVELIEIGANRLVGSDGSAIKEALRGDLPIPGPANIYGTGASAEQIADFFVSL